MRKIFLLLLVLAAWLPGYRAQAQLNKAYFFYAGRSFLIESKYRDAIEVLNILLRADSTAYEGYFLRGIAKYNLDDLIGADQDFSEAIRKNPVFTTAFQYRAITRMRMGNYDDALRDFQEAIDLRPDLPGPYYSRGVTYLLSQQFEKAIEDFNTFIRYDNKVSDAYINRGTSYLYLKDTTRALEDYNTAIRTNYFDPAGYNRRGALYMAQKKYDLALADFDKAVGYDSTYVPSYFHRAMVYSSTKRPVQAIEDFSRAIALDSTNALTYFNRAILRTQIGDYNRALDDYNRVAFYSPNNVLVYYNRAALYAQLGDYEAAIRDYSRAIELYPDFANAYLGRSSLRYMTNDLEGSRSDKQTAERKIAEYRSKLNDSTFSIYADTSRRFNQLLSFESEFAGNRYESLNAKTGNIALLPMFKFSLMTADTLPRPNLPGQYYVEQSEQFLRDVGDRGLRWVNRDSDLPADTLFLIDARFRRPAARRRRLVAGLFPARRLAVADPSVHELHRELYGGDRPQSVEPVPVYQPQYDAERDDRFHFVDRQRLPADRRRQRSEQPAEDSLRSRIRLRRSDRRPEQGGQAAARLCLYLLQPGQFALSFGPDARGDRGLYASDRAESVVRRGLL